MLLVKLRSCLLAISLLICWNSAYRLTRSRKFTSYPFNYLSVSDNGFHYRRTQTSILLTIPSFDDDYYQTGQSSSNDLSPSDIFLSLLESQLAIIVQSTNITHAAIYMNSENDESRDGDEQSVMQLVCSYPPTPRSLQDEDMTDIRTDSDEFDAYDKSSADGMDGNTKRGGSTGSAGSSIPSNRSSPAKKAEGNRWNPFSALEDADDDVSGTFDVNAAKEEVDMDADRADFDNDDVIKQGWAGGAESISTVYPIQFQGLNLGILQTVINKAFKNGDVTQNIPVFDFYDFQSSSQSSSWNPYKSDTSPTGCVVCESVVVSMGATIALELIRISSLAEAKRISRILKEREDNVFLRSSSAVITTKTLLKLLSKRLPKDDDIGLEIIKTINDQSDSISEAILRLVKPPLDSSSGYSNDEGEEGLEVEEEIEESVESAEVREWLELEKDKDALEGILEALSAEEQEKEKEKEKEKEQEEEEKEEEAAAVLLEGDTDVEEDEEEGGAGVAVDGADDGLGEFPFSVTTVQLTTSHDVSSTHHTYAAGADGDDIEAGDCAPRAADRSFFFSETDSTREPSSSNMHLARHEVPRTGDVEAEGVDFLFLETFDSKEKEVFVTFEMTATAQSGRVVAKGGGRNSSRGSKAGPKAGRESPAVAEVASTGPIVKAIEPIKKKKVPPMKRKKKPPQQP